MMAFALAAPHEHFRRAVLPQRRGRGDAVAWDVDIPWRRIGATPRLGRGYSVETCRAAAA